MPVLLLELRRFVRPDGENRMASWMLVDLTPPLRTHSRRSRQLLLQRFKLVRCKVVRRGNFMEPTGSFSARLKVRAKRL